MRPVSQSIEPSYVLNLMLGPSQNKLSHPPVLYSLVYGLEAWSAH